MKRLWLFMGIASVVASAVVSNASAQSTVTAAEKVEVLDMLRQADFAFGQLLRLQRAAENARNSKIRHDAELQQLRASEPGIQALLDALASGRDLMQEEESALQRYRQAKERIAHEHQERLRTYARDILSSMSTDQLVHLGLSDQDKRDIEERMNLFLNAGPAEWPRVRDRLAREVARVITRSMDRQPGESRRDYRLREEQIERSAEEWLDIARNNRAMWDEVRLRLAMAEERQERILQRVEEYLMAILEHPAAVEAIAERLRRID